MLALYFTKNVSPLQLLWNKFGNHIDVFHNKHASQYAKCSFYTRVHLQSTFTMYSHIANKYHSNASCNWWPTYMPISEEEKYANIEVQKKIKISTYLIFQMPQKHCSTYGSHICNHMHWRPFYKPRHEIQNAIQAIPFEQFHNLYNQIELSSVCCSPGFLQALVHCCSSLPLNFAQRTLRACPTGRLLHKCAIRSKVHVVGLPSGGRPWNNACGVNAILQPWMSLTIIPTR